jgi:secondary thiamine-phosphate synthase enzyme
MNKGVRYRVGGEALKADFKEISLSTRKRLDLVDITEQVASFVDDCKIESGICLINSPHSTSAIIVNEHESGLKEDILRKVQEEFFKGTGWQHNRVDNNAVAHLGSIFLGHSKMFPIKNGRLERGTWQNIFFLELDGPRIRRVLFEVMGV